MPATVSGLRGFSLGFKVSPLQIQVLGCIVCALSTEPRTSPCYVHFKEKVLTAKNTHLGREQVCVLAQVKPMVYAYQSSPRAFCFP